MKFNLPDMPPAQMLGALKSYNLLPAIIFLPTRRRCDEAASEAALLRRTSDDDDDARRAERREIVNAFIRDYPAVKAHRHRDVIIRGGVASHHAGHIPAWKLLIEKLMSAGLLDTIFATTTVAAGVDFPARTVVITQSDTRGSGGWRQLNASEVQQMTGRAGRRGKDNVGFAVVAPGIHQNPQRIAAMLAARPDALASQFRATYTTLLNLLDAYGSFAQVRAIASRSFAYRDMARRITRAESERDAAAAEIEKMFADLPCKMTLDDALGLERLTSAQSRLQEKLPQTRAEMRLNWLDDEVKAGRVVTIGFSLKRLAFVMRRGGGTFVGMRENGRGVNLSLERVGHVFAPTFPLSEQGIEQAFAAVRAQGMNPALPEPRLHEQRALENDALDVLQTVAERLVPETVTDADERRRCLETLWAARAAAERVERTERYIENLRAEVWEPFEQRARVLDAFGYLDFVNEKVTERGRWLADLRVDRPLLVGEALEHSVFASLDIVRAAALMAAIAADSDRDYGELRISDELVTLLGKFEEIAYRVSNEEWQQGLEPVPEINFSAAAATALWARGMEWRALVETTRAEEGDLVRLLSRTGEALLQVAGLRQAQPAAANIAAQAAEQILRPPVRQD